MSSVTQRGADRPLPPRRRISKKRMAKGQRAKRGRRTEYKDVFLQCGIIDARELAAVEGLRLMRDKAVDGETPLAPPSKSEGLRECVQRFAAFVGCGNNEASVEFCIPQVAHALELDTSTLDFVVNVLLSLGVVVQRERGTFLWREEKVWMQAEGSSAQLDRNLHQGPGHTSDLGGMCQSLLDVLKDSKEPLSLENLCQEFVKKTQIEVTKQTQHHIRCICSVLLGAGIVHEVANGSKWCCSLQPPTKPNSNPNAASSDVCVSNAVTSPIHPDQNRKISARQQWHVGAPVSIPLVLDDKLEATKRILDSLMQRPHPTDSSTTTQASFSDTSSIHAAVMEIAGSEICQVGVVDIVGHGSLTSPNNERTNSVIAVAVPQRMLSHQQLPHQIHAYEVVGLEKPFANQQPLYMSYVPPGSFTELLSHAVNGHKAVILNADALQQPMHAVSKLKQF